MSATWSRTTLRRAAPLLKDHVVDSTVAPDLPTLSLDFVLAEQALFNLLDNAAEIFAAGGRIAIEARRATAARVEIVVRDEGPGIPAGGARPAVRQVLSRRRWRPAARRHRPRPRHRQGLRRGPGRHASPPQPSRSQRRGIHRELPTLIADMTGDAATHPDRRGRAADPPPAAHDPGRPRLPHDRGGDRRRGAVGAAPPPARPGAARSRPARHRRPRADRAGSASCGAGADRRAVEPRRRGGQGRRRSISAPTTTSPSRSAPTS